MAPPSEWASSASRTKSGVAVGVGVHRDAADAGVLAGADDADGDLAAVGDQDLLQRLDVGVLVRHDSPRGPAGLLGETTAPRCRRPQGSRVIGWPQRHAAQVERVGSEGLPFDPIDEAARQWATHWERRPADARGDLADAGPAAGDRPARRAAQAVGADLRPLRGAGAARPSPRAARCPLGKMGERLQVHPTSVDLDRRPARGGRARRTPSPPGGRPRRARRDHRRGRAPGRARPPPSSSAPTSGSGRSTTSAPGASSPALLRPIREVGRRLLIVS